MSTQSFLVVVERQGDAVADITFELLAAARTLADATGGPGRSRSCSAVTRPPGRRHSPVPIGWWWSTIRCWPNSRRAPTWPRSSRSCGRKGRGRC